MNCGRGGKFGNVPSSSSSSLPLPPFYFNDRFGIVEQCHLQATIPTYLAVHTCCHEPSAPLWHPACHPSRNPLLPPPKQSPLPFISTVTADDHSSELMKSAAAPPGRERERASRESQETIEPPKTAAAAAVENTTASSGLSRRRE